MDWYNPVRLYLSRNKFLWTNRFVQQSTNIDTAQYRMFLNLSFVKYFFSNILYKCYFTKNEMLNICTTRFLLPTIGILYCYTQATCFTILINSATTIDVPKFFRCPLHKKLYTHNWIKEGNINTLMEKKSHNTHTIRVT